MAARSSNIHALIYKTKNAVELKNVKKQVLAALTSHFNWKLGILITFLANQQRRIKITRVVNPVHLQILRIDREGIIDDVIMQETWRHFVKKACEKDVVGIVTFVPDWFTYHQSHYCLHYNGILRFWGNVRCWKLNSSNKAKYLKFHWQRVKSTRHCKLRQLSGRFQTLIWRPRCLPIWQKNPVGVSKA